MTGVTGLAELVGAADHLRPTYIGEGLEALFETHSVPEQDGDGWTSAGWHAACPDGRLQVDGEGSGSDWWRVVAAAAWAWLDQTSEPVSIEGVQPPRRQVS